MGVSSWQLVIDGFAVQEAAQRGALFEFGTVMNISVPIGGYSMTFDFQVVFLGENDNTPYVKRHLSSSQAYMMFLAGQPKSGFDVSEFF